MISVLKNLKRWVEDKRKECDNWGYHRDSNNEGQKWAYDEVISRIDEILAVVEYKGDNDG